MLILLNLYRFLIDRLHKKIKKAIKEIAIFDNNIAKFKEHLLGVSYII